VLHEKGSSVAGQDMHVFLMKTLTTARD